MLPQHQADSGPCAGHEKEWLWQEAQNEQEKQAVQRRHEEDTRFRRWMFFLQPTGIYGPYFWGIRRGQRAATRLHK